MSVDQTLWGEYLAGAEWRGEDINQLNALPDEKKASLIGQFLAQQDMADKAYRAEQETKRQKALEQQTAERNHLNAALRESSNNLGWSPNAFDSSGKIKPASSVADTAVQAVAPALNTFKQATAPPVKQNGMAPTAINSGKGGDKTASAGATTTTIPTAVQPAVQQFVPTQTTQPVYQRPTEPAVQMGANGYPIYEQLPNGGYRYDTTYLDPQGRVDPYAMPNGIRGDFGDQEAYWNLRNRAASAKARYEQSQSANLQGEATTGLLQVQADPETHRRAQEYLQSGMALNAQEAMNLAAVEQAQRMGIWGAAANAYAPMQQGLDNAQIRNTTAGMYFGANTPYYTSANGYGARTGMNGVTFDSENGTVNVVLPNGQVVTGVNPDRAMAGAAARSPQAAMAARFNAATNFARANRGLYGNTGQLGAPTNAAVMALATSESNRAAKDAKNNKSTPPSPL